MAKKLFITIYDLKNVFGLDFSFDNIFVLEVFKRYEYGNADVESTVVFFSFVDFEQWLQIVCWLSGCLASFHVQILRL